jgi:hypothetical protein
MLKSFKEFKETVLKNHGKISLTNESVIQKSNPEPQQVRRKLGISTLNVKLPASISIKPVKIQSLFEEVIQLSDSDDDNRCFGDAPDTSDDEPLKPAETPILNKNGLPRKRDLGWEDVDLTVRKVPRFDPKAKIMVTCDVCGFKTQRGFFFSHFTMAHGKKYRNLLLLRASLKCDSCPRRFRNPDNLLHHQNNKHPDRDEFTCINCYSKFSSMALMKEHQRNFKCYKRQKKRIHKPSEKVLCPDCGLMTEKSKLAVHIKRKHLHEKNFQCAVS